MLNNYLRKRLLALFVALSMSVGFISTNVMAQDESSTLSPEQQLQIYFELRAYAETLLDEKSYQRAYDLLQFLDPNDPQVLFMFGLASNGLKQYEKAADYFQQVIDADPSQVRPRLELAQAQALAGQFGNAQNTLEAIPTQGLPAALQDGMERFAQSLEQRQKGATLGQASKSWTLIASTRLEYDTNINTATTDDTVTLFNVPFTLNNDAKANEGFGLKANLNFNHSHQLDTTKAIQSGLSLAYVDYDNFNTLDSLTLSGSTGLVAKTDDKTLISLPVSISQIKYNRNSWYSRTYAVTPQIRHQLDDKRSIGVNYSLGKTQYHASNASNSTDWSITPQMIWQIAEDTVLTASVAYGQKRANTNTRSNDYVAVSASYLKYLNNGAKLSLSTSLTSANYNGIEAAFSTGREDRTASISASYIKPLDNHDFDLFVTGSYTKNNSEHALYDYDRFIIGVGLQKQF